MYPVHKCSIISHFFRQWTKKMTYPLLVFDIHFKISNHDNPAISTYGFFPPAEFTAFHIPLHDVYSIFLVKGNSGYFIKTDNIIFAYQASLPVAHIHEHFRNGSFTARDKVRVRGNLLIQVRFTCPSGA